VSGSLPQAFDEKRHSQKKRWDNAPKRHPTVQYKTPREKITASSIAIPHHDRFGNDPLSHALGNPLGQPSAGTRCIDQSPRKLGL